ncbi:hypothetical protein [Microbulbifer pacificus]|uniref:Uncharacterized protein n=1 Tax=Microbulbifer pacificus TaxID=407164 RepID=A0AAU0MZ14_9GAMM|nr:hypothetical protein [Microbulbifer pacificus]WOX05932.1 hypothetical protein R5R33_01905 [Microbulbifer pacificus]
MNVFRTFGFISILLGIASQAQSATTGADPLTTDEAFCARMQQFIAGTDMPVENILYEEDSYWTGFKKSKPLAQPLTTHQYVRYQFADGERADYPVTVACKMKTAERIRIANAGMSEIRIADEDRECQKWQALMLDDVYGELEAQGKVDLLSRDRVALAEEDSVFIGPLWLRPELYQVAYSEGDTLKLRTKVLHVEYRRFMPVPDSFMGTHYCTMITPEYLAKLLQGEADAPPLQD